MLSLVQRLFYGPESALTSSKPAHDLRFGELAVLTPLVVLMLVMGLAPSLWLNSIQTGVHPPPIKSTVILSGGRRATAAEGPAVVLSTAQPQTSRAPSSRLLLAARVGTHDLNQPHPEAQR
jgi:hypothetical protein